jgi:HK97 family phage portal protein
VVAEGVSVNIIERFGRMLSTRTAGKIEGVSPYGQQLQLVSYMRGEGEVESVGSWPVARLWRTQPHLRTVVDLISQQVAALGLHVYRFDGDGGRERVRDSALQSLLEMPNREQTGVEFIYSLVTQLSLYDDAFVYVAFNGDGKLQARVVPATWVTLEVNESKTEVLGYIVNGVRLNRNDIVRFPGGTPDEPTQSASPVETLRTILDSENATHARRRNILTRGPRVGGVIQRPKDAPRWTDAARRTFDETWEAFQPGGERAGDAVLLEDGMSYTAPEFDASANGYKDGSVLSLSTVAQVFHIHPAILGISGAVGYQGVKEIRQALIGDSLAWTLKRIEARFTQVFLQLVGETGMYVEFNREARLQGSFEEQAVIIRQSVGAPFMTVNEARAMRNMPAVDGGDELIVPLNVTTEGGSNRSPEDDTAQQDGMKHLIDGVVSRARNAITAKRGAGDTSIDWARWTRELLEDAAKSGVELDDAAIGRALAEIGRL